MTLQIWLVDKRVGKVIIPIIKEVSDGQDPKKTITTLLAIVKKNKISLVCFPWRFTGKMKKKQLVSQNRSRIYKNTNTFIIDAIGRKVPTLGRRDILRENDLYKESMAATSYVMSNFWLPSVIKKYNFLANIFNTGELLLYGHCSAN